MTDALVLRDLSKTYRNGFQALKVLTSLCLKVNFMRC